ncbi:phosphonate metabolism transcriptional regulator PhnF [Mixta sp. Marseille-Q2659]|uniref:phosphonate metabolism transcriptional regulator PhnF n=1 Tax=Mixta sp. Marseille-Q2659 TaxID=2736607 RepID=UPI0023B8BBB5|nr:phosphonate metabolism transcriptional regulator PhnF [Mixta sp. Marseille-Q2659]
MSETISPLFGLDQRVAAQLEQELGSRYRAGDYLPTEQQLATRFAVNRQTLRRAVDALASKGLLLRRPGIGILVLTHSVNYPQYTRTCFSHNLLEQGSDPTSERLLAVVRPASQEVAAALACREGEQVIHVRTLRRLEGVPVCVTNHFLPQLSWWPRLQQYHSGSLYDFLQQHNQPLNLIKTRISTRRAQAKECRLLAIPLQAPLLCVRTLSQAADGQLTEYAIGLTRGDMTELTLEHLAMNNGEMR